MKNLLAVLIILSVASEALAQPQVSTGVYSLSGTLGFSSTKSDNVFGDNTVTKYSISPAVSYFLVDQIELSFSPLYSRETSERSDQFGPSTATGITLGSRLGIRYYFPVENTIPFVGASGGLSWTKVLGIFAVSDVYSPPIRTYFIEGGVDFLIAHFVAIETSLQYDGMKAQTLNKNGINLNFGVKYFIF